MKEFTLPKWVEKHLQYTLPGEMPNEKFEELKNRLEKFNEENPEVSIVIPAYNEEENLLKTLSSLADIKTSYKVELIVANNASIDKTQKILDRLGVKSVCAKKPGVSHARQAGLEAAKGKYILNADSDSIYPEGWVDAYVNALKNPEISCAYGTYSFVPSEGNSRLSLSVYEMIKDANATLKKRKSEFVNVFGFNFAFRKEDALKVGGFKHDLDRENTGRCEDGMMALELMSLGKIHQIKSTDAKVWTSDRVFDRDGGFLPGIQKRVTKEFKRIVDYV